MSDKIKKKSKFIINLNQTEIKIFIIIGVLIFILPLIFTLKLNIISFTETGQIGDTIGGITAPFLSFFGSILVYLALKAQINANDLVQKQFIKQQEIDYRQNFENTFFNLLTIHHQIFQNIDFDTENLIKNDSDLQKYFQSNPSYSAYLKDIRENKTIKSQDFFDLCYKILTALIEDDLIFDKKIYDVNHYYDGLNIELFKRIFFNIDGIKLSIINYNNISVESRMVSIYDTIYRKLNTDLGHYFRNLYRIIKLIDEKKFVENEVENFKIKYSYTSIIRAQLSDNEVGLLFFNCLTNKGYEKFKPLIEKYTLLKLIDISNNLNKYFACLYAPTAFKKPKEEDIEKHLMYYHNT
ncbi:putative phage abortive infection protein [Flavobacterium rhizosphaerae]|uniref:Phage abortive infection protein n=1 Tax=Flavobacterium rhizosphaerae TaxID=3163298 RepID=A0ABW8YSC6_9FLAO